MRRSLAALFLLNALAAPSAWAADGYGSSLTSDWFGTNTLIGEGIGENMYQKISDGGYAAEKAFYDQTVQGSVKDLNAQVRQVPGLQARLCGSQDPECRVFVRNLDASALDRATEDLNGALRRALNPVIFQQGVTGADLNQIIQIIKDYRAKKQKEIADASEKAQSLSMIGLYVDGDIDNSDYDIVADIEKINKRIFGKPPEYQGPLNRSKDAAGSLVSGPFLGGSNTEHGTIDDDVLSSTGFVYKDASARNCSAPAWSGSLVREVNQILNPQSPQNDAWGPLDPFAAAGLSTGTPIAKPAAKGDCGDDIFCIDIQFLTYQQNLLGYSKKKLVSLENVIDKHLPQIEKQSAKSFVQSSHTTNFGQLSFAGLLARYLKDNLSFKVEVNFLPPPFLASKGLPKDGGWTPYDGNWDAASALTDYFAQSSDEDTGIKNLVMQEMKSAGLGADNSRMNLLFLSNEDLKERLVVAQSEGGNTDSAAEKQAKVNESTAISDRVMTNQDLAEQVWVGGQAAKKLNTQLLEITGFSNSLRQSTEKLTAIIHSMAKKK